MMYKPQYLNVEREEKSAYGSNTAYFSKIIVKSNGFKWAVPKKKINKSGRRFLGEIR